MNTGWSSQKCCPATLLLNTKQWRWANHTTKLMQIKPSLTGVGILLDCIKNTYPCLPACLLNEHWLKQPKMLPCYIAVKCQNIKMYQTQQNCCKLTFPNWCRNAFGASKLYLSIFTSLHNDWTMAEAVKNAALPHCCWVLNNEDAPTTTVLLQIILPWLV